MKYPNDLLLYFQLSSTKYILIADYEYIFSEDFEARMLRIARNLLEERPKTALVFRIFEAKGTIDEMPRSKDDLYAAYRRGDAVEFHSKYAKGAHSIPGLKEWFERNCSHEQSAPDTVLPYKRYDWEPQFVALNTIPFHDENFPYPMRDNTELRWEMCRLSYKFVLVDDLFIVHPGIKTNPGKTQALRKIAWRRFHYALRQFNGMFPAKILYCDVVSKIMMHAVDEDMLQLILAPIVSSRQA
ncbi:N-acetyllactosaminide beta-1,3-N-acetylglucosaminyltransferase [Toxocara canis]|uniref:N-acetyllactosaminide beta-1,3-N-acetylglucosaminyltransferase n=1 Tax=Toxocara canis TaxID=6265 RepID=A0A0B2UYR9_TOXCA|nr:N-acetyllactosaminide beta-1,3-N-acetylglucosaminyltransferase [Toxocara canis]